MANFKVFLDNPNVPLDTNHLERVLRVIPMGRKHHLFCWSSKARDLLGWEPVITMDEQLAKMTKDT